MRHLRGVQGVGGEEALRKLARICDVCHGAVPARFRTVLNVFACEDCWTFYTTFHRLPTRAERAEETT